jgi:hypothetical protein
MIDRLVPLRPFCFSFTGIAQHPPSKALPFNPSRLITSSLVDYQEDSAISREREAHALLAQKHAADTHRIQVRLWFLVDLCPFSLARHIQVLRLHECMYA